MLPQRNSLVAAIRTFVDRGHHVTLTIGFSRWRLFQSSTQPIEGTYASETQLQADLSEALKKLNAKKLSVLFDGTIVAIATLAQNISLSTMGRLRYAQHCLRPMIGANIDQWHICLDDGNSTPAFCSAVRKVHLGTILSACANAKSQCVSARPQLLSALSNITYTQNPTVYCVEGIQSYQAVFWDASATPSLLAPISKATTADRKTAETDIRREAEKVGIPAGVRLRWITVESALATA